MLHVENQLSPNLQETQIVPHMHVSDFCFYFSSGYNAPYLSVYSENAVDIFDVNSMEWIQTIPLKKVTATRYCMLTV